MLNKIFIKYDRCDDFLLKADQMEKIGDVGLGLLRVACGKTVRVSSTVPPEVKAYSTMEKIAAMTLFLLLLPLTVLLATVGAFATVCSESHKEMHNLKTTPRTNDKEAILIQKHIRGYLARKAFLKLDTPSKYRELFNKGEESPFGKRQVFLPKEMPGIVLKKTGKEEGKERFHDTQMIRSFIRTYASSLVIPKSNMLDDFLIEERLPISGNSYHNIGVYLREPECFDQAAREMTRLFSRYYLTDLIGGDIVTLQHMPYYLDHIRHDNVPLYIEEEKGVRVGKIGFIDVDYFVDGPTEESLETLVKVFPLHLDVIKAEAKIHGIPFDEKKVDAAAAERKEHLQNVYTDHLDWIQRNDYSTPLEVSTERMKELETVVEKELEKLNSGVNDHVTTKRIMGWNPIRDITKSDVKELAKEITSKIVEGVSEKRGTHQKSELSDAERVEKLSLFIPRRVLYKKLRIILEDETKFNFENQGRSDTDEDREHVAEQLFIVALKEMVGKELYGYDPGYLSGAHNKCWLRF